MAELAQAQAILKETLDKVAALEAQFDEANSKKVRITCFCTTNIIFIDISLGDSKLRKGNPPYWLRRGRHHR